MRWLNAKDQRSQESEKCLLRAADRGAAEDSALHHMDRRHPMHICIGLSSQHIFMGHFRMKPKICKHCGKEFTPARAMQSVCGPLCASRYVKAQKKEKAATERATLKSRKEKAKTRGQWMREAQAAFNAFIRERDRAAGYPCISSGRPLDWSGNMVDAGHWRSTGAAPHLRFHEDNCHAQSKHDNQFLSGNAVEYRVRLIERIGLERVEALESDNEPRKYTIDDLKEIISTYKAKSRELAKARGV